MVSLDSRQNLGFYASHNAPTCRIEAKGKEALAILRSNWLHGMPSAPPYIVILDRNGMPKGLFRAECTLDWSPETGDASLQDLAFLPLPKIAESTSVEDFLQRICNYQHFAEIWALVDETGHFAGILEILPLLRQVVAKKLNPTPSLSLLGNLPNLNYTENQAIANLVGLVEQLPVPIVVYGRDGEVLGMNQLWKNCIQIGSMGDEFRAIASFDRPNFDRPSAEPVFCTSDGIEHTWQIFRVALTAEWKGLGVAIAQDITAQRHLAIELSDQNADLIRLNRLKDEFLACISHELKTPLTTIMGMTNLLNNPKVGSLSPDQRRYLQMVYRSSQNLTAVVDNIVDMAKAETGQLQISARLVDIRGLCDRAIQQLQSQYQAKAEILVKIDSQLTTLVADEKRLQQMLINLLSNAIKFSEREEEFDELTGLEQLNPPFIISLNVSQWEGWIAFSVSDRGIGIPEDKQHLLFQKFQQLESTRTRRFDGTGLGLVLTRHLARLHGGDVTFVSQEGLGSEFTILLPPIPPEILSSGGASTDSTTILLPEISIPPNQFKSGESKSSQSLNHDNRLVLIVETAPTDLEQMSSVLTAWGYRIVVARNGTEALEKARRLQPCLILLSPNLPSLSGWDVLALLKQDPATSQIRAIMALQSLAQNWEWSKYPADGFFLKPVQPSSLSIFLPRHHSRLEPLKILTLGKNLVIEISNALQELSHHLLEAEDGEQGEFLARIWRPDLILLSQDPIPSLIQIQQSFALSKLPILILAELDRTRTELERTFPELKLQIAPDIMPKIGFSSAKLSRLLERTLGHIQAPTVLLLDLTGTHVLNQSLQNYLMLAGIQVYLLDQPQLLSQQLLTYGADALLVALHDRQELSETEQEAIRILIQVQDLPPLIILDGRSAPQPSELIAQLLQMSTTVLDQPNAIADLITTLRQSIPL
jgi:signal transduction histidine kinase/FixJ family two-component response regulator